MKNPYNLFIFKSMCHAVWLCILLAFTLQSCTKSEAPTPIEHQERKPELKIIPYRHGDLWGFVKKDGSEIIAPRYEHAYLGWDGYGRIFEKGLTGLVSPDGQILIEPRYDYINQFYESRASFGIGSGLYGFIDESGKEVIPPRYEQVYDFLNHRAFVQRDQKWYLIDPQGNEIRVKDNLEPYFLDYFYETPGSSKSYDGDVLAVIHGSNQQVGLIDTNGNTILNPLYSSLSRPCLGVMIAGRGDYYGLIDRDGRTITPINFDYITRISETLYSGSKNSKAGLLNHKGEVVLPFDYDYIWAIPDNQFIASKNSKTGVITADGSITLPLDHFSLSYTNGYFISTNEGSRMGILDEKGNEILRHEYSHIEVLEKDRFLVEKNGKAGIIGKNNKVILPLDYAITQYGPESELYSAFFEQPKKLVLLEKDHEAYIFNSDGKRISDKKWQYLGYPDQFGLYVAHDAAFKENYISPEGKILATDLPVQKIRVRTVQELFDALSNNVEITLESGDYDMSELQGESEFASFQSFEGVRSLIISNVYNLTLKAENPGEVHLFTRSPFLPVLTFQMTNNVKLEGLKLGHAIEPGFCEGSVITAENVSYLYINKCDLYGSGTYGIEARYGSRIIVKESTIRECTYGIVYLQGIQNSGFYHCKLHDNGQFDLVEMHGSYQIVFSNVLFENNKVMEEWGPYAFFRTGSEYETVTLRQCTFRNNIADYISIFEESIILEETSLEGITIVEIPFSNMQ